jgi:hypothetical protein
LIVQALVHHPFPAFAALAVVALLGLPLVLRLPGAGQPQQITEAGT